MHDAEATTKIGRAEQAGSGPSRLLRWGLILGLAALAVAAIFGNGWESGGGRLFLLQRIQTFVTIFLGIFIEAVPFLLAGSLVSGFIAVFVDQSLIDRYLPKAMLPAAASGAAMGMLFPVCECGVVPVTRRLYEKGLPLSTGIAFLLAAPVINPIVLLSTYAAFGWGPVLWGRAIFSFVFAMGIGLLFHFAKPDEVLLAKVLEAKNEARRHAASTQHESPTTIPARSRQAMIAAGDDFLDMVRYLVLGSMIAAAMQTLVPQTALLAIGGGPVISVVAMLLLAFVLSICSTVDAFVALAFTGTFTTGSIVAFLVFGPMVDIKSSLMFLGVFRRRTVLYLIVLPFLLALLLGVFWNLNIGI